MIKDIDIECIHYGADKFDPSKFEPVRQRTDPCIQKPRGGLWLSPKESNWGWKRWCKDQDFHVERLNSSFTVRVRGRAAVIDGPQDLKDLTFRQLDFLHSANLRQVDFAAMAAEGIVAIHLTEKGERSTRYPEDSVYGLINNPQIFDPTRHAHLYGWDVETVLVLDPSALHFDDGQRVANFANLSARKRYLSKPSRA